MGVQNCGAVIKYLMIFFNFLFFILGIVVLGFGIYARIKQGDYNAALVIIEAGNSSWESFGSICIVVGVFIALLGGSGCFGAWKENRGCLIFFSVLVGLVFLLEVSAGALAYHYRNELNSKINGNMNSTLSRYIHDSNNSSQIVESWDTVQKTFKCCGIDNSTDYTILGGIIPNTCFPNQDTSLQPFSKGCKSKLFDVFSSHWKEWAGGVVGIAIVQLLAIVFALLLVREIGREGSYTVV